MFEYTRTLPTADRSVSLHTVFKGTLRWAVGLFLFPINIAYFPTRKQ